MQCQGVVDIDRLDVADMGTGTFVSRSELEVIAHLVTQGVDDMLAPAVRVGAFDVLLDGGECAGRAQRAHVDMEAAFTRCAAPIGLDESCRHHPEEHDTEGPVLVAKVVDGFALGAGKTCQRTFYMPSLSLSSELT